MIEYQTAVLENMSTLHIQEGALSQHQIDQLIEYSHNDETIRRFTQDPIRFASRESYDEFVEKNKPFLYALTDNTENLYGLVWFFLMPLPAQNRDFLEEINPEDFPYTMGGRLYEPFRGRGLGTQFKGESMKLFFEAVGANPGIWSETSSDNDRNIKINTNLGFRVVSTPNERNKILMVRQPVRT